MNRLKKPQLVLLFEHVGFLVIILFSWVNELLDLPRLVFGGNTRTNWRESAMETILVVVVWVAVYFSTKKVLARLYYLEGFPRICAWCRKVAHDDEWLPLEEFFERHFSVRTSHGICPACAAKMGADEPGVS